MGGLLYKDFVLVDRLGRIRVSLMLALVSAAYIILRIVFAGTGTFANVVALDEEGNIINLFDLFFVTLYGICLIAMLMIINGVAGKIIERDEKKKVSVYLSALPFAKNTYVASKYIFVGIVTYVMLSVASVWGIVTIAFCGEGEALDMANTMMGFTTSLLGLAMLTAAIELPLNLLVGKERTQMIKIIFWTVLAFLLIGYIMFGDLDWLSDRLNMTFLIEYVQEHLLAVTLFQALCPVIILGVYYLSYRIACYYYGKREA